MFSIEFIFRPPVDDDTLDLDLETLFNYTTNFYTYIETDNDRSDIAKRGRNKQHRHDLRQIGPVDALAQKQQDSPGKPVSEGNTPDSVLFQDTLTQIRSRVEAILGWLKELTLVYDRGNQSTENQLDSRRVELPLGGLCDAQRSSVAHRDPPRGCG